MDPFELERWLSTKDYYSVYDLQKHSPAYLKIRKKLLRRIRKIVKETFTPNQKKVFDLWMKRFTYNKINSALGKKSYNSAGHALKGIFIPKYEKYHGGIFKKIRKYCLKDPKVVELLKQLRHPEEEEAE